jgi:hypothetical protein
MHQIMKHATPTTIHAKSWIDIRLIICKVRKSEALSAKQSVKANSSSNTMATGGAAVPMWYEDDGLFAVDLEDEVSGQEFLNATPLDDTHFTSDPVKAQVNNVTACLGSKMVKDKKSEAARERILDGWTEMIPWCVAMTGLSEAACALPVDVDTIRSYRLENKDWKLPPYKITDNGVLMKHHIDIVGANYQRYCDLTKKEFKLQNPNGKYLPKTSFDVIKPLIGDICRYCIKYWHLHPWLSRENAYVNSIEHLRREYKWNNNLKNIIDALLATRTDAIVKKQLFALKTEEKPGTTTGELVFVENEDAALIISKFLKAEKWKLNKAHLDPVMDLKDCIEGITDATEKAEWKAKFDNVVPKETAAYLDKVNKAKEAEVRAQKKAEAKAAKESELQAKKRKALEESIVAAPAGTRRASATSTATTVNAAASRAAAELSADPFWEYKLKINTWEIEPQGAGTAKSVRQAKRQAKELQAAGIQKRIISVIATRDGKGTVNVRYVQPGSEWCTVFSWRFNNVAHAINIFGASSAGQKIVDACIDNKESVTITKFAARVVLATMMHTQLSAEKDYPDVGLHATFNESTFMADLKNTKKLWCSSCMVGNIINVHGLYRLACTNEDMAGTVKDARIKLLLEFVEEKESAEKAKQLQEIISILQNISAEIDGDDDYGGKPIPIDPFDTQSQIAGD